MTDYYFASVDEDSLMTLANYLDYIFCILREKDSLTIVFEEGIKEEMSELTNKPILGPFTKKDLPLSSRVLSGYGKNYSFEMKK